MWSFWANRAAIPAAGYGDMNVDLASVDNVAAEYLNYSGDITPHHLDDSSNMSSPSSTQTPLDAAGLHTEVQEPSPPEPMHEMIEGNDAEADLSYTPSHAPPFPATHTGSRSLSSSLNGEKTHRKRPRESGTPQGEPRGASHSRSTRSPSAGSWHTPRDTSVTSDSRVHGGEPPQKKQRVAGAGEIPDEAAMEDIALVKEEPTSPMLNAGGSTLPDEDLEEGQISTITAEQREIMSVALQQNLILTMKKDFDELPVLFINIMAKWETLQPESSLLRRPCVFLIPTTNQGRLAEWLELIAAHCPLAIGVIDAVPTVDKVAQETWNMLMSRDAIISSSEAFSKALSDELISISNFSLLMVDRVDLVLSHEPYTQIFAKHFKATERGQRPKVLGLTTLPYDVPDKFTRDVQMIEETLTARVLGIDDAVRDKISKSTQLVLAFERSPFNDENLSSLYADIHKLDESELVFRNNFRSAKYLTRDLGPYAADLLWHRHAASHEMRRNALIKEKKIPASFSAVEGARAKLIELVRAYKIPKMVLDLSSPDCNVTSKLVTLVNIVKGILAKEKKAFRGVVFVHKRTMAKALADVLNKMPHVLPSVRARALVGVGSAMFDPLADHLTKPQAIVQFKEGTINLLIMTSIGYDLEIPRCSIAIRFDTFEGQSAIEIQQCGVRKAAKIFLILTEKGKEKDVRAVTGVATHEFKGKSAGQKLQLPTRRPRDGAMESGDEDDQDDGREFIDVPGTESRIYAEDAPQVLMRFLSIRAKTSATLNCDYRSVEEKNRLFECTIHFLPSAELDDITSGPCPSKSAARRSAAYMGCQELKKRGLLQDIVAQAKKKLKSLTKTAKPSIFDGEEGVLQEMHRGKTKVTGTRTYPCKKLDFWKDSLKQSPDTLYPVIIYLDSGSQPLPDVHRTLCLLTRIPLPDLPPFEIYFPELNKFPDQNIAATVTVKLLRCAPTHLSSDVVDEIHRYTVRLVRSSTSKSFLCLPEQMAYYLVPMEYGWTPTAELQADSQSLVINELVDWKEVKRASGPAAVFPLDMNNLEEEIKDAIVQDREIEFTRKYAALCVRRDLTPLSKPPDSLREQPYESVLDYCRAKRRGFEGVADEDQPLLEVGKVAGTLNRLFPQVRLSSSTRKTPGKYLIPEICLKYCLSLSTYRTAMLLSCIMTRLEERLLVKECNNTMFEGGINEKYLREALTASSAGFGYDYERLELLGDSFLKYVSSIYLFASSPEDGEGAMHVARQRIISNNSLHFHSERKHLPQYIQSKPHVPRQWWPLNYRIYNSNMAPFLHAVERAAAAGLQVEGNSLGPRDLPSGGTGQVGSTVAQHATLITGSVEGMDHDDERIVPAFPVESAESGEPTDPMAFTSKELALLKEESEQVLGDKCIADVAEAVIGAAFLTSESREMALNACHALGLPISRMHSWNYLRDLAPQFFGSTSELSIVSIAKVEAVEKILGHKFKHPFLAATALTHASRSSRELPCYERLEFVGDAILDLLAVRLIYSRFGDLPPGWLTLLKGAMVCNPALAAVCVDLGLHKYIIHESHHLITTVEAYAEKITKLKEAEWAAASAENRPPGEYWAGLEPPKVLSDIIESLLGAIYVSDSFDHAGYDDVFNRIFQPFFLQHVSLDTLAQHPTKMLFERLQARSCEQFELVRSNAPTAALTDMQCDVRFHGRLLGRAIDTTIALAARRASAKALETIDADPSILQRLCHCRKLTVEKRLAMKKTESQATVPSEDIVADGDVVMEEQI